MNSNKDFTEKASNGAFVINGEHIDAEVEKADTLQTRTVDSIRHNVEKEETPVDPFRPAGEHMKTPIEEENMESSSNEISLKTKMHILLAPNEEGLVSSKHLYEVLDLDPSHYSRWCEINFFKNNKLKNGVKASNGAFAINGERINTGVEGYSEAQSFETAGIQPNARIDYLIPITMAEMICLKSKSKYRDEILEYFIQLEESVVKAAVAIKDFQVKLSNIENTINKLQTAQQENHKLGILNAARIDSISSADLFAKEQEQEWVHEQYENIKLLIKHHPGLNEGDISKGIDIVLWEMEHKGYIGKRYTIEDYASVYKSGHPGAKAYRLAVISEFEDLREGFENSIDELLVTYGAKKKVDLGGLLPELDIIDTELESETYEPRRIIDGVSEMEGLNKMYGEGWQERYAKTGEV